MCEQQSEVVQICAKAAKSQLHSEAMVQKKKNKGKEYGPGGK